MGHRRRAGGSEDLTPRARGRKTGVQDFHGNATHELINLLGALRLRLRALGDDPACRSAQSENLTAMMHALDQATTVVGTLHAWVSAYPPPSESSPAIAARKPRQTRGQRSRRA
jgi:hypothetical protein